MQYCYCHCSTFFTKYCQWYYNDFISRLLTSLVKRLLCGHRQTDTHTHTHAHIHTHTHTHDRLLYLDRWSVSNYKLQAPCPVHHG